MVATNNIMHDWEESGRRMRIKHCFYPGCNSEKIIKAHVFQNNGVLTQISVDGYVYMPKARDDKVIPKLTKYGRKIATTFSGFCSEHDKKLFQPIEDEKWEVNDENVFLFCYRTFAAQYQAKMEFINRFEILKTKSGYNQPNPIIDQGFKPAVRDFASEKNIFDSYLLNGGNPPIRFIAWEFKQPIKFAMSGFGTPSYDFDGKPIQKFESDKYHHVFYTILPQGNKAIAFIAWLKKDDKLLKPYTRELRKLDLKSRKQYLTNIAISQTDDLVLSPELVDKLSEAQKELIEGEYVGMQIFYKAMSKRYSSEIELSDSGINLFDF